jgi:hypothetical protein
MHNRILPLVHEINIFKKKEKLLLLLQVFALTCIFYITHHKKIVFIVLVSLLKLSILFLCKFLFDTSIGLKDAVVYVWITKLTAFLLKASTVPIIKPCQYICLSVYMNFIHILRTKPIVYKITSIIPRTNARVIYINSFLQVVFSHMHNPQVVCSIYDSFIQ